MHTAVKRLAVAVTMAAAAAPATAQQHDWSGFYAGVSGAYSFADAAIYNDYFADGSLIYASQLEFGQAFAGVRAGRNFDLPQGFVFGIETDLMFAGKGFARLETAANGVLAGTDDLYNISHVWTARLRLGMPRGDLLPFITGGIAAAHVRTGWDSIPPNDLFGRGSATAIGFTAGAGLEYAVHNHVRLNAEYRYTNLGTTALPVHEQDGFTSDFEKTLDTHAILFGATYAFGPRNSKRPELSPRPLL